MNNNILKLGGSESEIGLIISVFTISAVLLRPFIGRELDRRGSAIIRVEGSVNKTFEINNCA